MKRIRTTFLLIMGTIAVPDSWVRGAELDLQLAREPAEIVTTTGRIVRGTLDGFRDGRVHLRLATDGGEVGYSFAPAEIARLAMPGAAVEADALELLERGQTQEALPLLEALGRHRIRYLPLLDFSQQRLLWRLASIGSTTGDPHVALGIIRALAPAADSAEKHSSLLEAELQVFLRLDQPEEVHALARRWCAQADPAGETALGWRVLARLAFNEGDFESARWIALQPVAFSGHLPTRDLDLCYAIAIGSADHLGDIAHAATLRREMKDRGIDWPADPEFAQLGVHYAAVPDEAGLETVKPFFAPEPPRPPPLRRDSSAPQLPHKLTSATPDR